MSGNTHTVVIIGKKKSGKTQLFTRLIHDEYSENYVETSSVQTNWIKNDNGDLYVFHDTASDDKFYNQSVISQQAKAVLYCVDLSNIDLNEIKADLEEYTSKCLTSGKIILVGTKSDLVENPDAILTSIAQDIPGIQAHFSTSAKTGFQCSNDDGLYQKIVELCQQNHLPSQQSAMAIEANPPLPPPLLKQYAKMILAYTGGFAAAGAIAGAGIGVGMSITAAIPTLGIGLLASWVAIPIMAGVGAAAGAVLGLLVGVAMAGYLNKKCGGLSFFDTRPAPVDLAEKYKPLDQRFQ